MVPAAVAIFPERAARPHVMPLPASIVRCDHSQVGSDHELPRLAVNLRLV